MEINPFVHVAGPRLHAAGTIGEGVVLYGRSLLARRDSNAIRKWVNRRKYYFLDCVFAAVFNSEQGFAFKSA